MNDVPVGKRLVGNSQPVYIVAEAGVNHNGDIGLAKKLADAARDAGADAEKFQTFTPDEIVTEDADKAAYQKVVTGVDESQLEMLKKLALSYDDFRALKSHAETTGIEFLATPFSIPDADFLDSLHIAAFKVSSGDLTNLPFLAPLARLKKPVILSSGMATLEEVREAVDKLKRNGAVDIIILQCTSEYPALLSHANLRVMETFKSEFGLLVGFSDHTEGIEVAIAAASLGAVLIEKHFTLDKTLPGPDHRASLLPEELKEMVAQIRNIHTQKGFRIPEELLGTPRKIPTPEEKITAKLVRKGIAARRTIFSGETLTEKNIFIARPEGPIAPKEWGDVLGKKAVREIQAGISLSWDMLGK